MEHDAPGPATAVLRSALEMTAGAPLAEVYRAATSVGEWWPHRSRPDSHVALEPWAGGQFFETWADGGVLHGTVTGIQDGRRLDIAVPASVEGPASSAWSLRFDGPSRDRVRVVLASRAIVAADDRDAAQRAHTAYWQRVLDALSRQLRGPVNVTPFGGGVPQAAIRGTPTDSRLSGGAPSSTRPS